MAISKRARRAQGARMPDASAFVALIDRGLAKPEDVSAAYQHALDESLAEATYTQRQQAATADGGVVEHRPIVDPEERKTPEARLIRLHRRQIFTDANTQPQIQTPQEES